MATKAELQAEIARLTKAVEALTKAIEARPPYYYINRPYPYYQPWYPYWGTIWCGSGETSGVTITSATVDTNLMNVTASYGDTSTQINTV